MTADPAATPLWRLEVTVSETAVPPFEEVFAGICAAVTSFGDEGTPWRIEGYTDRAPDEQAIEAALALTSEAIGIDVPALRVEFLTPRDWLAENRATFRPLSVGRFFIYPSHFDGTMPAAAIPLRIDAGTAFGSGEHATTMLCLSALGALSKRRPARRVLDMGCGSGILAFAAALLWPARVLAVDIDPEAVRVTRANARDNRMGGRVAVACGAGYRAQAVQRRRPFDVIVANVLAWPLIAMAPDAVRTLAPGGHLVLSGLLTRDVEWVAAHHRKRGLVLERVLAHDGWAAIVFGKPGGG